MTPDEFKARYPVFAAHDVTLIQIAIDDADPWFNLGRWCGFYEQGLAAFVAHTLTLDAALLGSGGVESAAVASKSVGDVSVSYDTGMLGRYAGNPYLRTQYGQRYLYLRRLAGMGAIAV